MAVKFTALIYVCKNILSVKLDCLDWMYIFDRTNRMDSSILVYRTPTGIGGAAT